MNNKGKNAAKGQAPGSRNKKSRPSNSKGNQRMSIAAGYSSMQKQSMTWGGKPTKSMELRVAAYDIVAGPGTTLALRGSAGVGNETANVQLSLTEQTGYSSQNEFISSALDLEASSFTRFRAKKLKFKYCPQSGTNTTNQLVFAFAADSSHPLIFTNSPSQVKLESVADSIPFAPWEEWEMDVSRSISKDWLYTYAAGLDPRLSTLGVIGCLANTNGTAMTGDKFGILYVDLDVEFKEFCPISVARPTLNWLHKRLTKSLESPVEKEVARLVEQDSESKSGVLSSSNRPPKLTHTEFVPRFQELRKKYSAQESITLMAAQYRFSKSLKETLIAAFPGINLPPPISKDVGDKEKEDITKKGACEGLPSRIMTQGTADEFWLSSAKAGEGK